MNKFKLARIVATEAFILIVGVIYNIGAIIWESVFTRSETGPDNFDDVFHFKAGE